MDSSLLISLIFLGLFIGFLASMLGASGGIMFVPAFLSIFHLDPRIAIGTSIFCSLILSSSSSIGYISSKNVNWKISLIYLIGGIPATLTGAWLSTKISNLILTVICGASLAMMSMILILKKQKEEFKKEMSLRMKNKYLSSQSFEEFNYFEHKNISKEYNKNKTEHFRQWQENCPLAMNFENLLMTKLNDEKGSTHKNSVWQKKKIILMILASFVAGLAAGMVGMGEGTIFTASLVMIGMPFNLAAGSASLGVFIGNISGVISHASFGNILWSYAIPTSIAALAGASIGSRWATKLKGGTLKKILGVLTLFTSIGIFL